MSINNNIIRDLFVYQKLLDSQLNLRKLGIFSSVRIQPLGFDEKNENIDILIDVTERKSIILNAQVGFDSRYLGTGEFNFTKLNIFGSGKQLNTRAIAGQRYNRGEVTLSAPRIFGASWNLANQYFVQYENEPNFTATSFGGFFSTLKNFGQSWTLGIKEQIIVVTADAVLVADKQYSQQVKEIVKALGTEHRQLADDHRRVLRPWGYYEILAEGPTFKVKRLMVKSGAKLSLQMHQQRAEHWVVVSGQAEVVNGDIVMQLTANQSTYIPQKTRHRLSNSGAEPLYVIEVQSGHYLGEDDIVRFDDIYHRNTSDIGH